jgi:hypothetical protein
MSGVMFALALALSVTHDYNLLNGPVQFGSMAIVLAGPVLSGTFQYLLARKSARSALSLWGTVGAAAFIAPLVGVGCALLLAQPSPWA